MIGRGTVSIVRIGLVLVLALAAAVAANIVLLGVASGPKEPVGKLSPSAGLVQLPAGTSTSPATQPGSTTTTTVPHPGDDGGTSSKPDD